MQPGGTPIKVGDVERVDAQRVREEIDRDGDDIAPPSDESLKRLDELTGSGTSYLDDHDGLERRRVEAEKRARAERGLPVEGE